MKLARIAVLGIALAAGTGAALMMRSGTKPVETSVATLAPAAPALEVLVAAADLPLGHGLKPENMRWQAWPVDVPSTGLIKKSDEAGIVEELTGAIVRSPFLPGEPIRRERLIKADSGFMSAILPSGMRALAIAIDNRGTTNAGGFILPNDRVDVIQTSQVSQEGAASITKSEIILANVRVLAIGQNVQERNGEKVVTGETATLELAPAQAEQVVLAQKVGQLSLALRSLADVNETGTPKREERNAPLQIIRFGVQQQAHQP
jgi:pilus assembly protein CpaB